MEGEGCVMGARGLGFQNERADQIFSVSICTNPKAAFLTCGYRQI